MLYFDLVKRGSSENKAKDQRISLSPTPQQRHDDEVSDPSCAHLAVTRTPSVSPRDARNAAKKIQIPPQIRGVEAPLGQPLAFSCHGVLRHRARYS
ncbi:unnamed protein product, partial [Ectocarpus sp. 12 AP-2014]